MRVNGHVPDAEQRFERPDVVEVTVGENDRGGPRLPAVAGRGGLQNLRGAERQTGVDERSRRCGSERGGGRAGEIDVHEGDPQPRQVVDQRL